MDAQARQAAEAMYRALTLLPCTCLVQGYWPFRPPNKPDVTCHRCLAMRGWEAITQSEAA
jgi:hypothetical protein